MRGQGGDFVVKRGAAVGVDDVMGLVRDGRLTGARVGSSALWRIDRASVTAYLDAEAAVDRRSALWHESQSAGLPELWS